jgi:hypothetical protein
VFDTALVLNHIVYILLSPIHYLERVSFEFSNSNRFHLSSNSTITILYSIARSSPFACDPAATATELD